MQRTTIGTTLLDELIDGVHTGDNLVVLGDRDAPLDLVVGRFVATTAGRIPLVHVTLGTAWPDPVPEGVTVLDWSEAAAGTPASPAALAPDATLADAIAALERIDAEVGEGAAYVFDPLSDLPARWGADAALELFLATCPRLYRRRSLALWPIRVHAHRPTFLRRLEEVTQVVIELHSEDDALVTTVRKADGRAGEVVGRRVLTTVADDDLVAAGEPVGTRSRLGGAIREQRLVRGLSQTEVARRVGISPSALSQVERGVRGPSGDTLVRLWEVLDVPFGPGGSGPDDRGYRVSRRSGRDRVRLQEGLTGERLFEGGDGSATWMVAVDAGAAGTRAPFAVKAPERIVVLAGVLDLELTGRTETLHEGDGVDLDRVAVSGWGNPGPREARLLWSILGTGSPGDP